MQNNFEVFATKSRRKARKVVPTNKPIYTSKCIGEFSLDSNAKLVLGRAEQKFVCEELIGQKLDFDLLEGIDRQPKKRHMDSLNKIFHWLMAKNAPQSSLKEALNGCEFVVYRGPLSRIACAPFEAEGMYDVGHKLACVKYKGIYFIREFAKTQHVLHDEEFQRKMKYVGCKFEHLATTPDSRILPDFRAPVDPNSEFNGVFKASLKIGPSNGLNILCAAKVDAVCEKDGQFVELTSQMRHLGFGTNFGHKAINCYVQSYLVGIKKLVCGYHDDFRLKKMEYLLQDQLLPYCDAKFRLETCLTHLDAFLREIKHRLDCLPEGETVIAERAPYERNYQFSGEQYDDEHLEVISEKFRAHDWTE